MRILVINGSPKGKDSVTLQTVNYLEALFSEHSFDVLHAGQRIRGFERDFSAAKAALEAADLILFCYPVYTFLVPAQLHRFIDLIEESGAGVAGKFATQLSTSKHFYDTTAHRFIADRCADLGLRYIRGLSADMEDLLHKQGQREAEAFFRHVLWNIEHGYSERPSVEGREQAASPVIASTASAMPTTGEAFHVALVTDFDPQAPESALLALIDRFQARLQGSATCELINLHEFPFAGGCLGCFNCASDGTCIYKDGFDDYLRQHINSADAVVYAYTVCHHSMGYRFKLYDDRQFCNGHRTVTMGKPVGYLVDGELAAEENLRTLMEARAQVGGNYLVGVATDATNPDAEVDQLAETLAYVVRHHYEQPKNFYGVGGMKIFRDLIYQMQGLMKEDHRFYKQHGFYKDFPQRRKGTILGMYLVSALMANKTLRKRSKVSMTDGMLMPYRMIIEKAQKARAR